MQNLDINIDSSLVFRLNQSDQKAFDLIYDRYALQLYQSSFRRLQDEDICHDIIHDIFLSLWENRGKHEIQHLRGYLFQTLRYKVIDVIQQKSKTNTFYENYLQQLQKHFIGTDYQVRTKLLQEIIQKEINQFPPQMRKVFILSREQQLTYAEISLQLGISEQTVRSHIKHALRRLRLSLSFIIFILIFLTP